jgi:hypothetical protein
MAILLRTMKPKDFRRIALGMQGAHEGEHMGHPDFRAHGRIFATLYPDNLRGMVKLTPDQQQEFMAANPEIFEPASGAWGRQGCTTVRLDAADETTIGEAMTLAWQNSTKKAPPTKTSRPRPKNKRQKTKG